MKPPQKNKESRRQTPETTYIPAYERPKKIKGKRKSGLNIFIKNSMQSAEKDRPKTVYIKEEFFEMIKEDVKTIELRIDFSSFQKLNIGDCVSFTTGSGETVDVEIMDLRRYKTLDEVFAKEDLNKIAPGIPKKRIMDMADGFFTPDDIRKRGLLAIEFKKIAIN